MNDRFSEIPPEYEGVGEFSFTKKTKPLTSVLYGIRGDLKLTLEQWASPIDVDDVNAVVDELEGTLCTRIPNDVLINAFGLNQFRISDEVFSRSVVTVTLGVDSVNGLVKAKFVELSEKDIIFNGTSGGIDMNHTQDYTSDETSRIKDAEMETSLLYNRILFNKHDDINLIKQIDWGKLIQYQNDCLITFRIPHNVPFWDDIDLYKSSGTTRFEIRGKPSKHTLPASGKLPEFYANLVQGLIMLRIRIDIYNEIASKPFMYLCAGQFPLTYKLQTILVGGRDLTVTSKVFFEMRRTSRKFVIENLFFIFPNYFTKTLQKIVQFANMLKCPFANRIEHSAIFLETFLESLNQSMFALLELNIKALNMSASEKYTNTEVARQKMRTQEDTARLTGEFVRKISINKDTYIKQQYKKTFLPEYNALTLEIEMGKKSLEDAAHREKKRRLETSVLYDDDGELNFSS